MKKGGIYGGNTRTGLIFEGKTDLATFLSKQDGYRVENDEEIFYNGDLVARVFKKHKFYNVFLRKLGIDWKQYISKQLLPDDSIYVILNNILFIIECKHQEVAGSVDEKLQTCDFKKKQYQKLMSKANIDVEYIYLLDNWFLNRNIIGMDINPIALQRCREKVKFKHEGANGIVKISKCDARNLKPLPDESIDLICTHPPYANIIHYSEGQDIPQDLSNFKVNEFLEQMKSVASESYRVLKFGKFCAILMGDTRQKGHVIPLSFKTMQIFEDAGFKLTEIIMKEQHNCRATGYWKTNSIKYNFLLLAHEYLFIFEKASKK